MLNFANHSSLGGVIKYTLPLYKTVYNSPFEITHTDLWDASPNPSSGGFYYYIEFVYVYTKFTWIYFLRQKSKALTTFKFFLTYVQTQFYTKIKVDQSVFGGEFRPFTKYLNDLGIDHKLTCSHTFHQNGIVERKHKNIVEMWLTLLAQC